ncbi:histidine phosphotransferase family protein [Shimia ponticola]|uniref:histidine phosphotransferase family protein n=1 Tax=Shimia ponticola TaxID=2582893 RepID=UPI00164CB96C|nr:histidine phosphotransferase family protein [Shimia ponticola]
MTDPKPLTAEELVALVSSRICHDLVNPLGAISNGVELLDMAPDGAFGPEITLIRDSVQNANARLRFMRIAFGACQKGDMLDVSDISTTLDAMSAGMRQTIQWTPTDRVPRSEVKLCFLLLQCLETAMPFGGAVVVSKSDAVWTLNARAERFAEIGPLWRIITHADDVDNLAAAQVHFALAGAEQDAQAKRIDIVQDTGSIHVSIHPA